MPVVDLAGKVAVVTGGGKGVGRLLAGELVTAGVSVAIVGRNEAVLKSTAAELSSQGPAVLPLVADVSNSTVVETVRMARDSLGSIDILVNNAGVTSLGEIAAIDPDDWWHAFEVHVKAPMVWSQAVLPEMIQRGSGRIINVTSTAAVWTVPGASAYIASKAALSGFTRVLDAEVRSKGVLAFAYAPRLKSDMTEHIASSPVVPPAFREALAAVTEEELARRRQRSIDLFKRIISGDLDEYAGQHLESEDPPTSTRQ